eukprot:327137-Hanusia_phi.AAC.2
MANAREQNHLRVEKYDTIPHHFTSRDIAREAVFAQVSLRRNVIAQPCNRIHVRIIQPQPRVHHHLSAHHIRTEDGETNPSVLLDCPVDRLRTSPPFPHVRARQQRFDTTAPLVHRVTSRIELKLALVLEVFAHVQPAHVGLNQVPGFTHSVMHTIQCWIQEKCEGSDL